MFKPQGGRSPPRGLNRKPTKNLLFSLKYGAGAKTRVTDT